MLCSLHKNMVEAGRPDQRGIKKNNKYEQNKEQTKLLVFPNPTTGTFTARLDGSTDSFGINIINLKGEVIFTNTKPETEYSIDLSDFPSGMYVVMAITAKEIFNAKLIKE